MLKKLLLFLALSIPCFAQQYFNTQTFTAAGRGTTFNQVNAGIAYHKLNISLQGVVTACSLTVDSSIDGTTWVSGGILPAFNCSGAASVAVTVPTSAAFVSVNMVTLTGTAPVANVTYIGYTTPPIAPEYYCSSTAVINISTAVTTQIMAAVAGQSYKICGIYLMSAGTTNVTFEFGTGGTCGTNTVVKSGALPLLAGSIFAVSGTPELMRGAAGSAFCIINSAAIQVSGWVLASIY